MYEHPEIRIGEGNWENPEGYIIIEDKEAYNNDNPIERNSITRALEMLAERITGL